MELLQLRYFLAIAANNSFTRAAQILGISQPALSRAIARLEEELEQPVFERKPRSVELTEAGRVLYPRAQQAVALIDDIKTQINDNGTTGVVRVGAIPTIAPYFLPEALHRFAKSYPRASVQVVEDVTEVIEKRCEHGDVDVALVALPVSTSYLEVEELFEEELLLVLAAGHPLARKRHVTLDDVKAHPFVLLDEAHCLSHQIVSFCRQRSFQPVTMERTSQLATVQELVALDHGVSLVPAMARRIDMSKQRSYRSIDGVKPTRKIAMIWNPYRFQSRLTECFRTVLREVSRPVL